MFIGAILLVIGGVALLIQLGILTGSIWGYAWPVILIIIGLSFLLRGRFRGNRSWFGGCCGFPTHRDEEHH